MENKYGSVAVIGAGPAGMTAAIKAAAGANVTLFERNAKVGRKLAITGKGRCNVTNDCPRDEFFSHVLRGKKFLLSSVSRFPPKAVMEFFEDAGVPLKVERGLRVFPASDNAYDIVDALLRKLREAGVALKTGVRVESVDPCEDGFSVCAAGAAQTFDSVIVCTGGASYPLTGSTGDGYEFARRAGVPVTELIPSLVPVETKENVSALAGLTLKNVTLRVKGPDGSTVYDQMGELLFTHFGVSGPLVLSASANMRSHGADEYTLFIDLKPAVGAAEFDARLVRELSEFSGRDLINALKKTAPAALIPFIIRQAGADGRIRAGEVRRETRASLLDAYKSFRLTPVRFRPIEEAIVTAGGVDLSAVDPGSMAARGVPGLFFAGEVLDADAYTGGFNLQIAFSTGAAAGEAAEPAGEPDEAAEADCPVSGQTENTGDADRA